MLFVGETYRERIANAKTSINFRLRDQTPVPRGHQFPQEQDSKVNQAQDP